ncbi:MAG: hypothetical protein HY22_01805 [[Candidatus Thermochlorobacteriaceae] bacterium GBChlB]|jgi:putative addiction module component (TIGR02574 family)|nr:MAG: hypothetical protein HY22_01805 [[Candidatus Thermochlorobacteriaceae] bacterium GBChlB]
MSTADIVNMSVAERLALIEEIWRTLEQQPDALPITPAQKAELDARYAEFLENPTEGNTWEDVKARIQKKR